MILKSRKRIELLSVAGAMILALVLGLSACQGEPAAKLETVTVGMESTAVNSLIYIAVEQNYFAANGLEVVIKEYPSGLAAVNGMLNNEVDTATAAEFVVVGKALAGHSLRVLASIDKFRHIYLVGRKDRGINKFSDIKMKKIGVPLKTAAEFYLGRFLELRGMTPFPVALINVPPPQAVDALINGDVDAVVTWQPGVKTIEDRLGNGAVKWPVQSGQSAYCAVLGSEGWIKMNPERIKRFLKALARAEDHLVRYPDEARAIVQRRARYNDRDMATIWTEHQLSLSLDQSLILAMEDQARWMIRNKLTDEKNTPDFLDYIYVDALAAVRPGAVNIIR